MSKRHGSDLHSQALRLPQRARERLSALAKELHAAGYDLTAAQVTRGLCLLALELTLGRAGTTVAGVFRLAASDPTAPGVRSALDAFLWLLDVEPCTTPRFPDAHAGERASTSKRARRDLHNQALRLPQRVRDQLESLAAELRVAGADVTAGEVARGLCLLALEIVHDAAGTEIAEVFRIAASDPTAEGTRRALKAVQSLLDGVPSTMPDPPLLDDAAPTTRSEDSSPPSTLPAARAA
jgi:arginine repressor